MIAARLIAFDAYALLFLLDALPDPLVGLVPYDDGSVRCLTCGKILSSMNSGRRHFMLVHESSNSDRKGGFRFRV